MTQSELLFILGPPGYPQAPGFKEPTTSRAAALAVKDDAETLRAAVLAELRSMPGTADEIAERLNRDRLSVRPRLSELRAQGKIEPTGERRQNASGHGAIVWMAASRREAELMNV